MKFIGRKGSKFCGNKCSNAAAAEYKRRRLGMPINRQMKQCDVCGKIFTTRIAKQLRCCQACAAYAKSRRRFDKSRKSKRTPPRISPELIARRAAALKPAWWSNDPDLS